MLYREALCGLKTAMINELEDVISADGKSLTIAETKAIINGVF